MPGAFPGGPTAHLQVHKEGLVCLDVSRYRAAGAFPGGPKAHLQVLPGLAPPRVRQLLLQLLLLLCGALRGVRWVCPRADGTRRPTCGGGGQVRVRQGLYG